MGLAVDKVVGPKSKKKKKNLVSKDYANNGGKR